MRKLLHRQQEGDTIIEVLIAIAIVGSILGITYSIMNKNILIMRENQERTEAAKQAQGQVEALKALWDTTAGRQQLDAQGTSGFCVSNTTIIPLASGAPAATADAETDYAGYHPAQPAGSTCRFEELYHVGVRRVPSALTAHRYEVSVRWDKLANSRSTGKNEVMIVYGLD